MSLFIGDINMFYFIADISNRLECLSHKPKWKMKSVDESALTLNSVNQLVQNMASTNLGRAVKIDNRGYFLIIGVIHKVCALK